MFLDGAMVQAGRAVGLPVTQCPLEQQQRGGAPGTKRSAPVGLADQPLPGCTERITSIGCTLLKSG